MLKVEFKGSAELISRMKDFSEIMEKDAEECIQEMARTGSRQLAMRTEPFGLGNNAKQIGELSVSKDVSLAYSTNARTYNELKKVSKRKANAYAASINKGNLAEANKIVSSVSDFSGVNSTDTGEHLESLRNKKGRVPKANMQNLTNDGEVSKIRAKKMLTSGTAKAGWVQSGETIGSKTRYPKWLKKAFSNLGSSSIVKNGWKTVITLYNHVKYVSNVMTEDKVARALKATESNHLRRIQNILDHHASKF